MVKLQLPYWIGEFVLFVAVSMMCILAILLLFLIICTAIFTATGHMRLTGSLKREASFSTRQILTDAFEGALGYSIQLAVIIVPVGLLLVVAGFVTAMLKFQF